MTDDDIKMEERDPYVWYDVVASLIKEYDLDCDVRLDERRVLLLTPSDTEADRGDVTQAIQIITAWSIETLAEYFGALMDARTPAADPANEQL